MELLVVQLLQPAVLTPPHLVALLNCLHGNGNTVNYCLVYDAAATSSNFTIFGKFSGCICYCGVLKLVDSTVNPITIPATSNALQKKQYE